jgi:hypothetical protein
VRPGENILDGIQAGCDKAAVIAGLAVALMALFGFRLVLLTLKNSTLLQRPNICALDLSFT